MSLVRLYSTPGHLIRRLQQIAVGAFHSAVGAYNLTPIQYATLCGVDESDGLDIKKLADIVALDRSTLGGTVARLANRGLIERSVNEADKRAKLLKILPAGKRFLEEVEPLVMQAQDTMLERIPGADRELFIALLAKLVNLNNSLSRAPLKGNSRHGVDSLYRKPGHLIRRLQQISDGTFLESVGDRSVTAVQYASLIAVAEYPGLDNTKLSYLVALDRATLGSVVDRLQKKGWIDAERSEADRRAKSLIITQSGKTLLVELEPLIAAAEARVIAPLSKQEQRLFMQLLASVVNLTNDFSRAPQRWVDLSDVVGSNSESAKSPSLSSHKNPTR